MYAVMLRLTARVVVEEIEPGHDAIVGMEAFDHGRGDGRCVPDQRIVRARSTFVGPRCPSRLANTPPRRSASSRAAAQRSSGVNLLLEEDEHRSRHVPAMQAPPSGWYAFMRRVASMTRAVMERVNTLTGSSVSEGVHSGHGSRW